MVNIKNIIENLNYFWLHRKTYWGLVLGLCALIWCIWKYLAPFLSDNEQRTYYLLCVYLIPSTCFFVWWLCHSGRIVFRNKNFTVVFCLKAKDLTSNINIQNTMSILYRELDDLGLLEKIKIVFAGNDVITSCEKSKNYRKRTNVDLVIWGEILSGTNEEKDVCDFKGLFFTYKIPGVIIKMNLEDIFKKDINIAIIDRDWNIYNINSLPDAEKISTHLSEMIMFILGLIYCQNAEYAMDSSLILESLFKHLDMQTSGKEITVDQKNKLLLTTPAMLRKGRVLAILLNVYKNLGLRFLILKDYCNAKFYLDKFRSYKRKDINVLAGLSLCAFYLNRQDITDAKKYTEEIGEIDKDNEILIFNRAFFGIFEKNYPSALFFYKEIVKKVNSNDFKVSITNIISFLDERKNEYPDECAYDFAIGLLSYYFCDEQMGEKELKKFLKHAKSNVYTEMVNYTKDKILKKRNITGKKRANRQNYEKQLTLAKKS